MAIRVEIEMPWKYRVFLLPSHAYFHGGVSHLIFTIIMIIMMIIVAVSFIININIFFCDKNFF